MIQKRFSFRDNKIALILALFFPLYLAIRADLLVAPLNWLYMYIPVWLAAAQIVIGSIALCALVDVPPQSRAFAWIFAILLASGVFVYPSLGKVKASGDMGVCSGLLYLSILYALVRYMIRAIRGRNPKEISQTHKIPTDESIGPQK